MIGFCRFPVTSDGAFAGTLAIKCSYEAVPDVSYRNLKPVGVVGQTIRVDDRLFENTESLLSTVSSYQAVSLLTEDATPRRPIFVSVIGNFGSLSGASEGVALFIALCGIKMADNFCATGYVSAIGSAGGDNALDLAILPIDCAAEKVTGCAKDKITIMLPAANVEQDKIRVPYAKMAAVRTVKDVLRFCDKKVI